MLNLEKIKFSSRMYVGFNLKNHKRYKKINDIKINDKKISDIKNKWYKK